MTSNEPMRCSPNFYPQKFGEHFKKPARYFSFTGFMFA